MQLPDTLVVLVDVCGKDARPSFRAGQTPPARSDDSGSAHRVGWVKNAECSLVGFSSHLAAAYPRPRPAFFSHPRPGPRRTGASASRLEPDAGRRAHARRRAGVAASAHAGGRCAAEGCTPRDHCGGLGRALDHCTNNNASSGVCARVRARGCVSCIVRARQGTAVRVHVAVPTSTHAPVMEQLRCGEPA